MLNVFKTPPRMFGEAAQAARGHIWIVELLIFVLVFSATNFVENIPFTLMLAVKMIVDPASVFGWVGSFNSLSDVVVNMPTDMRIMFLYSTGIMTACVIAYCKLVEKRGLKTLGFRRDGAVREYLIGIAAAFVMISAAAGLGYITGAYTFTVSAVSVPLMLLYLFGFVIQGMAEEVLCRGYLTVSLARRNPVWLSVLLSSLVFAALHIGNPGMDVFAYINVFLIGALLAVYTLKRGNIWGACALHSFWNFFQSNLYGISVSGTGWGAGASPLVATAKEGADILSGGIFGIEGGLCDTAVEVAALLIVIFLVPAKKNEFSQFE